MSSMIRLAKAVVLIGSSVALLIACESSPVLAPTGTTILMGANPPRVVFDPTVTTPVKVTVTAQLINPNGYPQNSVAVFFSTTAGSLASEGREVKTDSRSTAQDVLTVTIDSPNSIDVTATSGSISQKITLTKTVGGLAPSDGSIVVHANPGTVQIDPNQGQTSGTSSIDAQAFDKNGSPLAGIAILFTPTSGTGTLSPPSDLTNASGVAHTTLTVPSTDSADTVVTATSSALSANVTVHRTVTALNKPPTAVLNAVPANSVQVGNQVIFDGSNSSDPDLPSGKVLTFHWTIVSDSACCQTPQPTGCIDRCANEDFTDTTSLSLSRIYHDSPQTLFIQLQVTDDKGASNTTNIKNYQILCANPPPVANAGPDQTANAAPGQTVTVVLSGLNTTDDKPISNTADHWRWDCGNGTLPRPIAGDFRQVTCSYTALSGTPNTWTATLTVYDNGATGDLVNGVYPCQKSNSDTATVTLKTP